MPTLISNYKKQTYVTGLQKAYSVLNNMTKTAMSSDEVTNFSDTQLMQLWSGSRYAGEGSVAFAGELKKYFPNAELIDINKTAGYPYLAGLYKEKAEGRGHDYGQAEQGYHLYKNPLFSSQSFVCFMNQDSILYCFSVDSPRPSGGGSGTGEDFAHPVTWSYGLKHILVDVNGYKKPNQLGRDFFVFSVGYKTGRVLPAGSKAINDDFAKAVSLMNCSGAPAQYQAACKNSVAESFDRSYEEATKANYYCFNTEAQKKPEGNNLYCADKIIKEGWKMNY